MMDAPATFLTIETLRTLAGQVLVVVMLTQAVKSAWSTVNIYVLRLVAVVSGIIVHAALAWSAGMPLSSYMLALANGALVGMTAMKAAELVKGEKGA